MNLVSNNEIQKNANDGTNAMVTNHLRAPYGVYFTKYRTILRRPYGARPAAGRIVRFFYHFFRHRTVPGEV